MGKFPLKHVPCGLELDNFEHASTDSSNGMADNETVSSSAPDTPTSKHLRHKIEDEHEFSTDEILLMKMEARLDAEGGADRSNLETFGADATSGWSFEENVRANERLELASTQVQRPKQKAQSRARPEGPAWAAPGPRRAKGTLRSALRARGAEVMARLADSSASEVPSHTMPMPTLLRTQHPAVAERGFDPLLPLKKRMPSWLESECAGLAALETTAITGLQPSWIGIRPGANPFARERSPACMIRDITNQDHVLHQPSKLSPR